jgi:hypothetical protein
MKDQLHLLNNLLVPLVGYRELVDQRLLELTELSAVDRELAVADLRMLVCEMCDCADRASVIVSELQRMLPPTPTPHGSEQEPTKS